MIKIGTIGTGKIVEEFIKAALKNPNLEIACCYSRKKDKAQSIIRKYKLYARAVDSFNVMIDEVDAVYIATPNGLHFEQAKYFIQLQKHVLLEKPLTLEYNQALELSKLAIMNNVILMEAYKTIHLPQFAILFEYSNNINPFLATFNLKQYSSRMENVKKGIYDSVFDEKLGKGSTYDMLIYPVELAISLFGPVKEVKAMGLKLPNGSGLNDCVLLRHENEVIVNIVCSKASAGTIKNEISSDMATIIFDDCISLKNISVLSHQNMNKNTVYEENAPLEVNLFDYELAVFSKMILNNDYKLRDYLLNISCEAIKVLNVIERNQDERGVI
ncbi:Gfo/Idh/MocA family protein [Spiroplasma apis]|uniref:Oxidoreductase n=1 Tax=Spiroplasma apis B31 TaxID=1276258 RepID=V5RIJ7_SPIAP|nr:Gfo/Idh/MocA family oxidoreductase [Spiroplasma apis]AHB36389.1 oxidoreductase [Spiroplasma apis B31]